MFAVKVNNKASLLSPQQYFRAWFETSFPLPPSSDACWVWALWVPLASWVSSSFWFWVSQPPTEALLLAPLHVLEGKRWHPTQSPFAHYSPAQPTFHRHHWICLLLATYLQTQKYLLTLLLFVPCYCSQHLLVNHKANTTTHPFLPPTRPTSTIFLLQAKQLLGTRSVP